MPALYRVKSMHELTEYMNFDWIKVINEHYLKNSHINNDSVVLVDAYEAMARFSLLLSETNKKFVKLIQLINDTFDEYLFLELSQMHSRLDFFITTSISIFLTTSIRKRR